MQVEEKHGEEGFPVRRMSDGRDGADPWVPIMGHKPVVDCAVPTLIESQQPSLLDAGGCELPHRAFLNFLGCGIDGGKGW